jgi:hypothetical protein
MIRRLYIELLALLKITSNSWTNSCIKTDNSDGEEEGLVRYKAIEVLR